jgi:hypothetical protein
LECPFVRWDRGLFPLGLKEKERKKGTMKKKKKKLKRWRGVWVVEEPAESCPSRRQRRDEALSLEAE